MKESEGKTPMFLLSEFFVLGEGWKCELFFLNPLLFSEMYKDWRFGWSVNFFKCERFVVAFVGKWLIRAHDTILLIKQL